MLTFEFVAIVKEVLMIHAYLILLFLVLMMNNA